MSGSTVCDRGSQASREAPARVVRSVRRVVRGAIATALAVTLVVLCAASAQAQDVRVQVVDASTLAPLSESSVELRATDGTRQRLVAQSDGRFVVPAAGGRILVSHVGYTTRVVTVPSEPDLTVELEASPLELDQVTVTATRAAKRLEDAPGSASVITRASMETRNIARLDHAVALTPGVYNHSSNMLDDTHGSVHVRGITGQKRTLVLMDGVPLNDGYNGGFRFAGFAAGDLERVEVVRGPNSSLYGGSAMAGVINFVTRMPESRSLRADIGYSPGLNADNALSRQRKVYVSAGDRFGSVSVLASYSRQATDGYAWNVVNRPAQEGTGSVLATGFLRTQDRTGNPVYTVGHSGVRSAQDESVSAKLAWDVSPETRVTLSGTLVGARHGHDAPNTFLRDADGTPVWSGSIGIEDGGPRTFALSSGQFLSSYGGKRHMFVSGNLTTRAGGAEIRAVAGYSGFRSWYSIYDGSATFDGGSGSIVRIPTPSMNADVQSSFAIGTTQLMTVGATFKRDRAESTDRNLTNWRDTTAVDGLRYEAGGTVTTLAAFAQNEVQLRDNVTAYLGLRFDTWRTHDGYANDVGKPNFPAEYDARSSSFLSPRLAFVVRPATDTRLTFSAARAFRGPTVFELYRTWTLSSGQVYYANPELGPEANLAFDAGVQQRFGGFTASATVFQNNLRDMVNSRTLENGDVLYINTGRVRTQGLELQAEQRLTAGARVFANYTRTDTEVIENETAPQTEGKELTGVPAHQFNVGAELLQGPWRVGAHGRYASKRWQTDTNVDSVNGVFTSADPFFVLDLRASYQLRGLRFGASLDNALNRQYFDYFLAPGRTFILQLGADLL